MNKSKYALTLILALTLVVCFTFFASASSSIMRYSFKSEDNREVDWYIARTLHYGGPEYNNTYIYHYNNQYDQEYDQEYNYEGGSTNVWVNGTLENGGYIETDINKNQD